MPRPCRSSLFRPRRSRDTRILHPRFLPSCSFLARGSRRTERNPLGDGSGWARDAYTGCPAHEIMERGTSERKFVLAQWRRDSPLRSYLARGPLTPRAGAGPSSATLGAPQSSAAGTTEGESTFACLAERGAPRAPSPPRPVGGEVDRDSLQGWPHARRFPARRGRRPAIGEGVGETAPSVLRTGGPPPPAGGPAPCVRSSHGGPRRSEAGRKRVVLRRFIRSPPGDG